MKSMDQEYEDLPEDARTECRERLTKTIEALHKIKNDLAQAEKDNPMARTLLVTGLPKGLYPTAEVLVTGINKGSGNDIHALEGCSVFNEKNYKYYNATFQQVDECYIQLRRPKDARHLLDLCDLMFHHDGHGRKLRFTRANEDDKTRETFRKIGQMVERLKVVTKELNDIGIDTYDWSKPPTLNMTNYIDEADFDQYMVEWERARAAGQTLPTMAHGILRIKTPVNIKKRKAQMTELYNEECDIRMQLRKFQRNGWIFTF